MILEPGTVVEERVGLPDSKETSLWGLRIVVPSGTEDVGKYIRDKIKSKGLKPTDGKITETAMCTETCHTLVKWRLN